jgi:hypothetical protein
MSFGCIFLLVLMLVVIAFNIKMVNKKRKILDYDKRKTSLNYMEAVQLPMIGANTARQFINH